MNTKILISFLAFIAMFFNACSQSENNSSENEQIMTMLKNFYSSYITQIAQKGPPNMNKINAIQKKYCSLKLLNKIENEEELDYDPFLNAQDANVENLKTLSIKKDLKVKNGYVVSYTDSYSKQKININLLVVKEKEYFKIDDIVF